MDRQNVAPNLHDAGMMPREMPSFASGSHTSLSSPAVQPCQHIFLGWPARRQRISLMRKKIELARRGFRLLELQSHSGSNAVPDDACWTQRRHAYRTADRLQGQLRCASSRVERPPWVDKNFGAREERERRLTAQRSSRYSSNSKSENLQLAGREASVAARDPPNEAAIALQRANLLDAAQRSSDWPSISATEPATPAVNGRSSKQAARATQLRRADEAAEDIALQQVNLHAATPDQPTSVKVISLWGCVRVLIAVNVMHSWINLSVAVLSTDDVVSVPMSGGVISSSAAFDCRLNRVQKMSFRMSH